MPDMIRDGKGTGSLASVTDNRLDVSSRAQSRVYYTSRETGLAFTWSNLSYNYDANDTILLIKNTSRVNRLVITHFFLSGDTTTQFVLHSPTCSTPTGTEVIGVNSNRQSAELAEAEAVSDETTNTRANIVGSGFILAGMTLPIDTQGAIILGYNDCIAVDYVTDGGAALVTIGGFYERND
jgi:hypothetical protein